MASACKAGFGVFRCDELVPDAASGRVAMLAGPMNDSASTGYASDFQLQGR